MRVRIFAMVSLSVLILGCALVHGQAPEPAAADANKKPDLYKGTGWLEGFNDWEECKEYLPTANKPCRIDFDLSQTRNGKLPAPVHKDVAIWPGATGKAVVVLQNSSPFASCSLSGSSSPLARDLSTNIGSALGILGTLGAVTFSPAEVVQPPPAPAPAPLNGPEPPGYKAVEDLIAAFNKDAANYNNLDKDFADLKLIKEEYKYSYPKGINGETVDKPVRVAVDAVYNAAADYLANPLPDPAKDPVTLDKDLKAIDDAVANFASSYPPGTPAYTYVEKVRSEASEARSRLAQFKSPAVVAKVVYLADTTASIKTLADFITDFKAKDVAGISSVSSSDWSVQLLPVAIYPTSKVAVTVKCTDPVTKNPVFDSIQFNVFYQKPPSWDISAGVLVSFLHGRQVGTVTGGTSAAPTYTLGVTSRSRVQFMPGTFVEYHPWNFRLPWAKDPALTKEPTKSTWMGLKSPAHPAGYVGSFGLAGGFLVNPNNGAGEAEFFEGVSLAIQRFSILVGDHTGRSQNFAKGFAVGDPVTAGFAPPTVRNWSNGLSIGLTYRIVLR